ncbi:MAG: type II toxin-antitoxin system RelE/ParE family toxin [Verrucomicrobiota bacterium JB022]|nr:type II toxin-antitoxin system RelE/ParE family toxin [Verrucomicrobiota bacterium JB022]
MRVTIDARARAELQEAARYYDGCEAGLGDRFAAAAQLQLRKIELSPFQYRSCAAGCRISRIQAFPYSIIYQLSNDRILVVAFLHHSRRPGYWTSRL